MRPDVCTPSKIERVSGKLSEPALETQPEQGRGGQRDEGRNKQ
jgi:hypothetical protein